MAKATDTIRRRKMVSPPRPTSRIGWRASASTNLVPTAKRHGFGSGCSGGPSGGMRHGHAGRGRGKSCMRTLSSADTK